MWAASNNGNPEVIAALLKGGARLDDRDENGLTALMHAARDNPLPAGISALLGAGAAIDAADESGMTALMWAVQSNPNPECISALLDAGADGRAWTRRARRQSSMPRTTRS
jgi:ankyrin repeat protein